MIEIIPNWHPVFVHFTIALLIIATLFHIIAVLNNKSTTYYQFESVANWNLWTGALFAVVTVIAGWFAYNSVEHDTPSHLAMTDHRNWALGTTVLFIALAVWSFRRAKKSVAISWLIVLPLIIASGLLGITGWKGGELVYRHGLGVMSLPNTGAHDHAGHEHAGDEHAHGDQNSGALGDVSEEAEQEVGEKAHLHEQDTESQPVESAPMENESAAKSEETPSEHDHDHGDHTH
jgi:uncharacterized membrane protein